MVSVTKKYQVTIPKEVREDLGIHSGDKVVFIKNPQGNWVIMSGKKLAEIMIESSQGIEKTELESKKGFQKGSKKNLQVLGD
jgi:antitoxin PrlF